MLFIRRTLILVVLCIVTAALPTRAENPFRFRDVTQGCGLLPDVGGIRGHGAGWGDIDGDGWFDLYVATFHNQGSKPNLLFRNQQGQFRLEQKSDVAISTRATGVVFADLDNDGDLDLYVASMPAPAGSRLADREGHALAGCSLFRNDGDGTFSNISHENGACPAEFGGRSATVLDFDGDGLLDLLVGEDPVPGYNGSPTHSSRLFRNRGRLQFSDVSRDVGLPADIPGLGVAAADLNNDGWPDFFVASSRGGNRLLLNDGKGRFYEPQLDSELFAWPGAGEQGGDNMICGVCFGDVNRDGNLDMVLGQHFAQPWLEPVANRLYLHRSVRDGVPQFENVTAAAGLVPLPMKAPHVEIQDFDNDGLQDISTSIVKFADGEPHPLIFRNLGQQQGLPRFQEYALAVNDFPNAEDRQVRRTGEFFDKMIRERRILYTAPGPTADFDNDGRLDMFLTNWWIESPSLLLRNESQTGNWLQVEVIGTGVVNRMAIGARIHIYAAGQMGNAEHLLGSREVAAGYGYASGQPAVAHFGLGQAERVDIEVILPHGQGHLSRQAVAANQRITIE